MPWDEQDCLPNEKCEHGHNKRLCLRDQGYEPYAVDNGRHFYRKWFPAEVSAPAVPAFDEVSAADIGPALSVEDWRALCSRPTQTTPVLVDYDSDAERASEGMVRE